MRRPAAAVLATAAVAALVTGACSVPGYRNGVVTNPPATATPRGTTPATASGTGAPQTSGERTVLAQDGLRIHSGPSLSDSVLGTVSWGVSLAVTGYTAAGGGFYGVQGATVSGWITADPTLSASGNLDGVAFSDKSIAGVLYPQGWTFADDPGEIVLTPESGVDLPTLVIKTGTSVAALGALGIPGYAVVSRDDQVVACGYTGAVTEYAAPSGTTPEPTTDPGGGAVDRLPFFVQFRVEVTSQFWLDIEMNYSTEDQLTVFDNAYNSIEFPYPECQQPASASPSAAS
jgi:hypothetical protein